MKRVLAIAAMLAAASAWADEQVGQLSQHGRYLGHATGSTVTLLEDGSVVVYGQGPEIDGRLSPQEQAAMLRGRRQAPRTAVVHPEPRLWDPVARGWRRLPYAPECQTAMRYLHTATALAGARVLFAGGLCDEPKFADDASPHAAFTRLSLLDVRSRRWVDAPSLREARIQHTASLMRDGSVVFVGGETDPALSDAPEPVLASVERFNGRGVEPIAPLKTARARHSASVMADGSLLVAGGVDSSGRAIAAVEILDPALAAWRELPPLLEARHGHTATVLRDGRVVIAGGKAADGRALRSTEIWDPAREAWLSGPVMPMPLHGHGAALLASGDVLLAGGAWTAASGEPMPWAWTWGPSTAEWRPAGRTQPVTDTDLARATIAARPDGSAVVFTDRSILRWMAGPPPAAPLWQSTPAIAALKGARAMLVALEVGANEPTARVWDAASKQWTFAGRLDLRVDATARELPDGHVLYVGIDRDMHNTLVCRVWQAPESWSDCGGHALQYQPRGRPELGVLADGRAFAIANEHEAFVLDGGRWAAWRIEWNRDDFKAYGAPVREDKPFAQLVDPSSGTPFPVDDAAARYYMRNLAGRKMVAMLWDAREGRWGYLFKTRDMGADAQWLPDGCAISTNPLAMFDLASGTVHGLSDPGFGIEHREGAMAVLDDGTVVVAGISAGKDPGAGFFEGKASCAGFAGPADYISGGLAPREIPVAAPATAPAPRSTLERWVERIKPLAERKWLIAAIVVPFGLYLLLRRTRIGRAHAPASRGFRVAIYVIIAIVLAPFAWLFIRFYFVTSASDCLDSRVACEKHPPWWIALAQRVNPEPPVPCEFVGVWTSRQGSTVHRIELKDDGTYVLHPNRARVSRSQTGRWNVAKDEMIWRYDASPGTRDVNPIERVNEKRFNLTETDGRTTHFELVRKVTGKRCGS